MDGFVCNLKNNSDQEQEINLFNSSDQNGQSTTTTYTYTGTLGGATPILNRANSLFYDQALAVQTGEVGVQFTKKDGSILDYRTTATIANYTATLLEAELNNKLREGGTGLPPQGTWTVTIDDLVTLTVTIRFEADSDWIQLNDINTNLSGGGSGGFTFATGGVWTSAVGFGAVYLGDTLKGNPNVRVQAFSDFSYNEFLWSTLQRTYDVKNFQIYSTNKEQLLEPFLFDRKLASGKKYQKVLTPSIDPYQSQNYIITPDNKGYILDGFTEIKYKLLPNASVRLILDYTYVDLATPLIAKLEQPQLKPEYITPKFVDNMEKGFDKFGCDFLIKRSRVLSAKLQWLIDGKPPHPQFSNQAGPINSNVIPCWGCVDGEVEQHGTSGGNTGFNNANVNGVCGTINGVTYYNSPTHSQLEDCVSPTTPNEPTGGGGNNPIWQNQIKSKLLYIKQMMINYDCMTRDEVEELPEFEMIGTEYRRMNLWMPSPEFVQHQLDTEQGARKLYQKHDFPIVVNDF